MCIACHWVRQCNVCVKCIFNDILQTKNGSKRRNT